MFQESDEKLDQGHLGMLDPLKLDFYQSTPHKTHQTAHQQYQHISKTVHQKHQQFSSISASAPSAHQQQHCISSISILAVKCTGRHVCPYTSINSGHISLYTLTPQDTTIHASDTTRHHQTCSRHHQTSTRQWFCGSVKHRK